MFHNSGCMICAKPLVYFKQNKTLKCYICSTEESSNACCEDEHYVCDSCHMKKAADIITYYCLTSTSKNPIQMTKDIIPFVNMHGPEHHYMVPAILLTCYKNDSKDIDLAKSLIIARERAENVPGGICGFWGSCGAAIGAGIYVSIVTKATPLTTKSWSLSNLVTSICLKEISENGGPRCCKRNVFLALKVATEFTKNHLNSNFETTEKIECYYSDKNLQCRKDDCLFFPKKA